MKLSRCVHWVEKYLFWIVFSIFFLLLSGLLSYYGLFGNFQSRVLGVKYQFIYDPGLDYLTSGLTFFKQDKILWAGHPGFTLMLAIQIMTKIYYWLCTLVPRTGIPFETFVAKNIFWVIWISKILITIVHLLSFFALYTVARAILKDRRSSYVAVVAYASSYPVLYYINNISPEPFLVAFTLLAVYFIWRYYENLEKIRISYQYLFLASGCSAAAFYTKIIFIAPFIVLLPIYLLLQRRNLARPDAIIPLPRRALDSGIFILMSVPSFILGSMKLNWQGFISLWINVSSFGPNGKSWNTDAMSILNGRYEGLSQIVQVTTSVGLSLVSYVLSDFSPIKWLPGLSTINGQFNSAELLFAILAVVGFILFWRHNKDQRSYLNLFFLLILITLPIIAFRNAWSESWHYCFINLAIGAVFVGYLAKLAMKHQGSHTQGTIQGFALSMCAALLVHAVSWVLFFDLKMNDIKQFNTDSAVFYEALRKVDYNHKIAVVQNAVQPFYGGVNRFNEENNIKIFLPFASRIEQFFIPVPSSYSFEDMKDNIIDRYNIQVFITYDSQHHLFASRLGG
jgi:hypothetical protein